MGRVIVFTDLDGTLLDHHTYRFDEALELLGCLKAHAIPLIIVTSKTRPEVLRLQRQLGICEPFIVENGAGAFLPAGSDLGGEATEDPAWNRFADARFYTAIRTAFAALQRHFELRGFGDMEVEEVMALTELDRDGAAEAMRRDFTEPFVAAEGTDIDALRSLARLEGLDVVEGGRFYHLITLGADKGNALRRIAALYGDDVRTIALGDGMNDKTMLEAASEAVLIPRHDGSFAPVGIDKVLRARYPGPRGWNQALKELLDEC